jgi:hypothetical protein
MGIDGHIMTQRQPLLILLTLGWLVSVCAAGPSPSAASVDEAIYAKLLADYVKDGVVNYSGFKREETKLDEYLQVIERTDSRGRSRGEQLAFYINAYNAWTIKLILSKYPGISSIKELGSFFSGPWKKRICRIDGQLLSLDDIEHGIIRPRFGDPRIHFAVNCASQSCPPLLSQPYRGDAIDVQLDGAARAFINNSKWNRLDGSILYVSKIFDWYRDDFKDGVVSFFLKYADGSLKKDLTAGKGRTEVRYLEYDWSLNGQ